MAVAGLSVVGRDNYGVFPLRGKLLNVRDAKLDQILKNEEIQNIKKILGLQHNKDYKDNTGLRYGRIMIMTDQVCCLLYSLHLMQLTSMRLKGSRRIPYQGSYFELSRPFLPVTSKGSKVSGRICDSNRSSTLYSLLQISSPDIRCNRLPRVINESTFSRFLNTSDGWNRLQMCTVGSQSTTRWVVSLFCAFIVLSVNQGLGTSQDSDAREYFSQMGKHMIPFSTIKEEERQLIELAFSKKKADDRKEWLRQLKVGRYILMSRIRADNITAWHLPQPRYR